MDGGRTATAEKVRMKRSKQRKEELIDISKAAARLTQFHRTTHTALWTAGRLPHGILLPRGLPSRGPPTIACRRSDQRLCVFRHVRVVTGCRASWFHRPASVELREFALLVASVSPLRNLVSWPGFVVLLSDSVTASTSLAVIAHCPRTTCVVCGLSRMSRFLLRSVIFTTSDSAQARERLQGTWRREAKTYVAPGRCNRACPP